MLFDDEASEELERMLERDSDATGGLGALRASGEGERHWQMSVHFE